MQDIIDQFSDRHVLVVGDVMLDVYDFCYTEHSRPSPEKQGARVYKASRQLKVLGGAANVASNCIALGAQTSLLGIGGNDAYCSEIEEMAKNLGIQTVLMRDANRRTSVKTRLYIDDNYVLRRDDETIDKIDEKMASSIHQYFEEVLPKIDVVILSDYNKGIFTEADTPAIIGLCRKHAVPVIVDFKPINQSYFKGATIIAPNLVEAQGIMPEFVLEKLQDNCKELHRILSAENLIVTLGGEGICGQDETGFFKLPVHEVDVVDPVGCGDTVRAVLALAFASGLSLKESADIANLAASLAVQKIGTVVITAEELTACIEHHMEG